MTPQEQAHEENARRRIAVALGSLPLNIKVMDFSVRVDGFDVNLAWDSDDNGKGYWGATIDHDWTDYEGHVSCGTGGTPEAALAECLALAKAWDKANPE